MGTLYVVHVLIMCYSGETRDSAVMAFIGRKRAAPRPRWVLIYCSFLQYLLPQLQTNVLELAGEWHLFVRRLSYLMLNVVVYSTVALFWICTGSRAGSCPVTDVMCEMRGSIPPRSYARIVCSSSLVHSFVTLKLLLSHIYLQYSGCNCCLQVRIKATNEQTDEFLAGGGDKIPAALSTFMYSASCNFNTLYHIYA